MSTRDIVVVGGSAGALAALKGLLAPLPEALPASIFIVVHGSADAPALLAGILAETTALPVASAAADGPFVPGSVYLAPPGHHLLLHGDGLLLARGPQENNQRPSIDALFRSAAVSYGPRVIGLVVSGTLDDGVIGMQAIKTCGGLALVQDPAEAEYPELPTRILAHAGTDHCARVARLADLLAALVREPAPGRDAWPVPEALAIEAEFELLERGIADMAALGEPTSLGCPLCHGPLSEMSDPAALRYRCHTGHAFSAESLSGAQEDDIERALYAAVRAVDEGATLAQRMALSWGSRFPRQRQLAQAKAAEFEQTGRVLRRLLLRRALSSRPA